MSQVKTKFLENNAVDASKIASNAVTTAKINNDAVDKDKINADVAGNGLGQNVDGSLEVNVDNSTIELNSDAIRVKDAGITNAKVATGIDAAKIADGSVSNSEFQFINSLTSNAQTQLDSKVSKAGSTMDSAANLTFAGGGTVKGLPLPSVGTDAANKNYVDNVASGLDVKGSVRALQDSNLALTGGASLSVDSVSLANGNRILLTGQTSALQNGIYDVSGIGSAYSLTRSSDADTSAEVTAGMFTFVTEGTNYADTGWVLTTNDPIVLDTDALAFTQFSGAGSIVAGAGLTKTGSTLDVVSANSAIVANANDIALTLATSSGLEISSGLKVKLEATDPSLQISSGELGVKFDPAGALSKTSAGTKANVDGSTLEISSNALRVKDAGITLAKLASNSVDENKLTTSVAGSGLAGGGGVALSVNTGDGIEISADAVKAKVSDFAGAGLEDDGSNNLRVKVDSVTTKLNGSNQVQGLIPELQSITLSGTDITNQYFDLAQKAHIKSVMFMIDGLVQKPNTDYQVDNSGAVSRIKFDNTTVPSSDLKSGGNAALVNGDIVHIWYSYLG